MSELLAPAGNYEAFIAAINAGANAVYIGLNSFSARAYANNFTIDEIKNLVEYAHLRNVKVFVTMNTIIFQDELPQAYSTIDELAKANIDAIIIQDLALLDYVAKCYPSIEAHASTQMGIDDLDYFFSQSSVRIPWVDFGWRNAMVISSAPLRGVLSIRRIP